MHYRGSKLFGWCIYFFFMIQTININATLASEVIQSNDAMDGFIFAYMVKTTFVSGRINNASIPRICKVLGIGNRVARRGLKSALERGYVRREGDDIIANRLYERKDYVYPLQIKIIRGKKCPFRFTQLRRIIREVVIENHISKQEDFCNTIECSVNPTAHKPYVRAKRRIKRMCKKEIAENTDRLSNRRIMEIANLRRSTAKNIMRELVKSKTLSKTPNIEPTDIDIEKHIGTEHTAPYFRKKVQHWCHIFADSIGKGFPVLQWKMIDQRNYHLMVNIQYANSYKVANPKIRLFL